MIKNTYYAGRSDSRRFVEHLTAGGRAFLRDCGEGTAWLKRVAPCLVGCALDKDTRHVADRDAINERLYEFRRRRQRCQQGNDNDLPAIRSSEMSKPPPREVLRHNPPLNQMKLEVHRMGRARRRNHWCTREELRSRSSLNLDPPVKNSFCRFCCDNVERYNAPQRNQKSKGEWVKLKEPGEGKKREGQRDPNDQ